MQQPQTLASRRKIAESYGFHFDYEGQSEGFRSVKMSLNTTSGAVNLLIRDSHIKIKTPQDSTYTRWPLEEFDNMLELVFSTYKITD